MNQQEIRADDAPEPVGAYPHARRVGDLLFLSGVGPRQPETDATPGGPVRDEQGQPLASGVYLVRLATGNRVQSRKILLLR